MPTRRGARHLLVSAFALACAALALRAQELPFRHFTTENQIASLPSSAVQQVFQDREGYIWIAFYSSGVGRYDGQTIETYSTSDGLPELMAREIVQDGAGYLWVGTEQGLAVSERPLPQYKPGERVRFVRRVGAVELPRTRIRRNWLYAAPDGAVWVGTTGDGLLRCVRKGASLTITRVATARSGQEAQRPVIAVAGFRGDVVAALDGRGMIRVTANGAHVSEIDAASLPNDVVSAFAESSSGGLWAGTMHGGVWRGDADLRFQHVATVGTSRVFTVLQSSENELWVATLGEGAARVSTEGDVIPITRLSGLLSESVWSIARDREGNLWFAQNGGVSRLEPDFAAFGSYTGTSHAGEVPALPDAGAFSVLAPQRSGSALARYLFVGTGGGVAVLDGPRSVARLTGAEGLRGSAIYVMAAGADGAVWAAGVDGANRISSAKRRSGNTIVIDGREYTLQTFDLRGPVYASLSATSGDGMWLAGQGGVHWIHDGVVRTFSEMSGLPSTGATSLAQSPDGRLWVGTPDTGLFRSTTPLAADRSPRGETLAFERALPRTEISGTIHEIESVANELWVATANGLFVVDPEQGRIVDRLDASRLGGPNAMSIAAAREGVWVAQNAGLSLIDPLTRKVKRSVAKREGLLDNEVWAYDALDVGDKIYVATARGLAVYDPASDRRNELPPVPVIRRAEYRENRAGDNEVNVEYAALSFVNERGIRFRTRLAGYDNWTERGAESKLRYTNLPAFLFPREYTLEVLAVNADGVASRAAARMRFTVHPALWFRAWFLALVSLLVAVTAVFLYRLRTARYAAMNRDLEALVRARTEKIAAQADELRTFNEIVQVINREVRLERLLEALLDQGIRMFPRAEKAAFLVFDRSGERCSVAASRGYDPSLLTNLSFTAEEAVRRYCEFAEFLGEGVYLSRRVPDLPGAEKTGHLPQPKAMLAMEVASSGMLEGFLVFDNFSDANAFDSSDLDKLSRLRQHAISAISKARMLRELEIKNREAEQASQAKSAFLANMSHELRTPLNSIIGFSEILVERFEKTLEPRFVNFLRLILTSGQHLLTLINDILDLSKIEAGKMEIYPDVVQLQNVVESVCVVMRPLSTKKNIAIEVDVPPHPVLIETDPGKLKQILYNLLSNAVKFSPHGATVHVFATVEANELRMYVRDEGIGIAPEHLDLIFEEFRQLDSSARRKYEGTGLGLSLVKKLVELQKGTVRVESEIGEGSRFSVRMPVRVVSGLETPNGEDTTRHVLVVEDEDHAYSTIARHLSAAGYSTIRARTGEEAMQMARKAQPLAITLDLILPGSDGIDVLKRLKSDDATQQIPVVIITITENRELAYALGADDYLTKPIDPLLLKRRIAQLIAARGVQRRPRLLFVDDDVSMHRVVEEALTSEGFEVETAIDAREAFDLLNSSGTPDVVVLDLTLPGVSGFEIAERLKAQPETASLPIVIFTSRDLTREERERLERHVAATVPKGDRAAARLVSELRRVDAARPVSPS